MNTGVTRHSESNPIELFFNRTQLTSSNLIRGLSSIVFDGEVRVFYINYVQVRYEFLTEIYL